MMRGALLGISLVCAALPAQAAITTFGSSAARECFDQAQTGLKEAGAEACTKALTDQLSDRDRAATFVNRGIIYNRTKQLDLALSDFNAALQLNGALAEAYLNRGNTHFYRRAFDQAAADYSKAIELKSANLEVAYYNRALANEMLGKYDEATKDLNGALQIRPDFKDATQQLAEVAKRKAAAAQGVSPAPTAPTTTTPPTSGQH